MQIGIRSAAVIAALLVFIVAGLAYFAADRINLASKGAGDGRDAMFQSYRVAQSLKALAAGYELTMNEYYSTVLEFPAYQKKSADQKLEIERELAALAALPDGGAETKAEFARLYQEIDTYRRSLEDAMAAPEKDWDRAREALYKLNVISVQVIHRADALGQIASESATALDQGWQARQFDALQLLRIAILISLAAGVALLFGAVRSGRAPV